MSFQLTVVDAKGRPMPNGLSLVLLAGGKAVASASVEERGRVTFDTSVNVTQRLAIRLNFEDFLLDLTPTTGSAVSGGQAMVHGGK